MTQDQTIPELIERALRQLRPADGPPDLRAGRETLTRALAASGQADPAIVTTLVRTATARTGDRAWTVHAEDWRAMALAELGRQPSPEWQLRQALLSLRRARAEEAKAVRYLKAAGAQLGSADPRVIGRLSRLAAATCPDDEWIAIARRELTR